MGLVLCYSQRKDIFVTYNYFEKPVGFAVGFFLRLRKLHCGMEGNLREDTDIA